MLMFSNTKTSFQRGSREDSLSQLALKSSKCVFVCHYTRLHSHAAFCGALHRQRGFFFKADDDESLTQPQTCIST